jgi:hypothetical protein
MFADLYAAFTAEAFLFFDHDGLLVLELIDLNRAYFHTFPATHAFLDTHFRFVGHNTSSSSIPL